VKNLKKTIYSAAIFLFLFTTSIFADELTEIINAILEKGARWKAGITSVSILSHQERKNLLGGGKTLFPPEDRKISPPIKKMYPLTLDWRDYNGKDYTTPVKDQGTCGSCWAFGTLGTLEAMINVKADSENPEMDLSEQELLSCSPGSCNGYKIDSTCQYVKDYGASEEACFPYMADDNIPCSDRCDEAVFTNRRIEDFDWCFNSVDGLKEHLQYGPIDVRFQVYEDFYSYTAGVYKHVYGSFEGWHIVNMIGWNDTDTCWIVKNSWGKNWGEEGYFRIAYGECSIEDYAIWLTPEPSHYPYIKNVSTILNDSIYGDGDGVLNPGETADIYITLKNYPGWSDAFSTDATLRTDETGVFIEDSIAVYGTIVSDTAITNTLDPFTLSVNPFIEPGEKGFDLFVTALGDSGDPYWVKLPFIIEIGWNQYGWPAFTGIVKSSPCIIDLSGDVRKEVIFGSDDANLYVKDYKAEDVTGFPLKIGNKIWSSTACGDVDNDGIMDISFGGFNGNIYLVKNDGSIVFNISTGGPVTATPALFDLDSDSKLEIIIGSFSKKLYVLKSDGTSYNDSFPFASPDGGVIYSGVTLCDLDGDNKREIVYATLSGNIYALKDDGTIVPGWPYHIGGQIYGSPSSANLDGTGMKVVVGSTNDTLVILNGDGSLNLQIAVSGEIRTSPSFADIDNDNDLEIFFSCSDSSVYGFHHNGYPVSGWPFKTDAPVKSSPCFSDLDNDGKPEVIAASESGTVYVIDSDGSIITPYPLAIPASATSPAVSDIDMDGDEEIIIGTSVGVTVLDHKEQSGSGLYWNMFRCNPYRTGCYEDIFICVKEKEVKKHKIARLFPNPFASSLKLFLSETINGPVEISVYNIAGQKVRTIFSQKGESIIIWDGKTNAGIELPSGTYFITVKIAESGKQLLKEKVVKMR